MPKVTFGALPEQQDFSPLPLCKYPCVLRVTNIAKASDGQVMTDGDGKPATLKTNAGDERWDFNSLVLGGAHVGREIRDNISFGEKAFKRAQIIFIRAGIIEEGAGEHDFQPDELDQTCWWVEIDAHEQGKNRDGTLKFKKDGKTPLMYQKVAFAGYTLMQPAEAKKYRAEYDAWLAKKGTGARAVDAEVAGDDDDPPPF